MKTEYFTIIFTVQVIQNSGEGSEGSEVVSATLFTLLLWTMSSVALLHISGVVMPKTTFVAGVNAARRWAILSRYLRERESGDRNGEGRGGAQVSSVEMPCV